MGQESEIAINTSPRPTPTPTPTPTVFVRDFASKAILLFLYHDLGRAFVDDDAIVQANGEAWKLAETLARLIPTTVSDGYRHLMDKRNGFPKASSAIALGGRFSEETFRGLVKSDGAGCLTATRGTMRPSRWYEHLLTVLAPSTVGKLLNFISFGDASAKPVETPTTTAYASLKPENRERPFMRIFAGASFRSADGKKIATLERATPRLAVGKDYHRDHVHMETEYRPDDIFVTEVETDMLYRLAIAFGFGCNCPETATLRTWEDAIATSSDLVRDVWKQFAGSVEVLEGGLELRGRTLEDFSASYFDLLASATHARPFGEMFTGRQIRRLAIPRGKRAGRDARPDPAKTFTQYQFWSDETEIQGSDADANNIDYSLEILSTAQRTIGLQLFAGWVAGQDKYAFKDLRLVLKTAPVQASFKVESGTWPNHPVSMANGGKAKFHFPGFGPNFRVRISLSDASDLAQTPVFPAPGAELCRLVRIEEGVSFTGDFMVRAGSLARTSGADASAMGGLKDAVQQFLAARGRCGASNGGYITMASKSWTVKKAEP